MAILLFFSLQLLVGGIGVALGICTYGPMAIFGVAASESAPPHLAGTAHALVALAGSGKWAPPLFCIKTQT